MATPPTLPVPILDLVLSQGGLSDADLARCALVSSTFLDLARRSLYWRLSLKVDEWTLRLKAGGAGQLKQIEADPTLAGLVREVVLEKQDTKAGDSVSEETLQNSYARYLAAVLGNCRNVRRVNVQRSPASVDFTTKLTAASPTLTHLSLNHGTSFFPIARFFPCLQSLTFFPIPRKPYTLPSAVPPISLTSLALHLPPFVDDLRHDAIRLFSGSIYLSSVVSLTHLRIPLSFLTFFDTRPHLVPPNLTSLHLETQSVWFRERDYPSFRHVAELKYLRNLTISGLSGLRSELNNFRRRVLPDQFPSTLSELRLERGLTPSEATDLAIVGSHQALRRLAWRPDTDYLLEEEVSFEVEAVRKGCELIGVE
ncbi:hypothetical protein JCM8547_007245 [Rhodosporidiobolus lusitaniae]